MDNNTLSIRTGITFLMERHSLAKNMLNVNAFNCKDGDPTNHIQYKKPMLINAFGVDLALQWVVGT